jgi:hypothetical protein
MYDMELQKINVFIVEFICKHYLSASCKTCFVIRMSIVLKISAVNHHDTMTSIL